MRIPIFSFLLICGMGFVQAQENGVARYVNGLVLRGHELKQEDLWVSGGQIVAPQPHADEEVDVHGLIIAPGYIDIQINGGFGCDFSSEPENVDRVAAALPQHGVTAFLPTVISSSPEQYRHALPLLQPRSVQGGASILGIHLEGPFFCPERRGAHGRHHLQGFDHPVALEAVYGNLEGVRIVTLAPELPNALPAIQALKSLGILVSAGHTNASYEAMLQGIGAGITLATHLFNAMAPLHHREPGVIGAALTRPEMSYSIIADGVHVHPAAIRLAWQAHPKGIVLITDAIAAMGLSEGSYRLGTEEVVVRKDKAVIAGADTIAGSIISMDAAVRFFHQATGCSIVDAIEAASAKPAQLLGIEDKKGTLKIGADADFIVLDKDLHVLACYVAGERVWGRVR